MKTSLAYNPRPKPPARVRSAVLSMHAAEVSLHLAIIAGEKPDKTTARFINQRMDDCRSLLGLARAELATFLVDQLMADRERIQTEVFATATDLVRMEAGR